MSSNLFCFGYGYSAQALAVKMMAKGWQVCGTARTVAPEGARHNTGAQLYPFSRESGSDALLGAMNEASHLLISIPPDEEGDPVADLLGEAIADHPNLAWVGYLSTTGVYGNHDGAWVTEDSALLPTSPRSRRRVAAEDAWRDLSQKAGFPLNIFRLAGIYGPGRNALETVRAGKAKRIDVPGQVFGRIHVEDIAKVLEASIAAPRPGRVYNVSDDEPAAPAEVIEFACQLLGVTPPPLESLETAGLSPMGRSFYQDNKRVSNRRLHDELGVTLGYPDYRKGLLRACKRPGELTRLQQGLDGPEEPRQVLLGGKAVVAGLDQGDLQVAR